MYYNPTSTISPSSISFAPVVIDPSTILPCVCDHTDDAFASYNDGTCLDDVDEFGCPNQVSNTDFCFSPNFSWCNAVVNETHGCFKPYTGEAYPAFDSHWETHSFEEYSSPMMPQDIFHVFKSPRVTWFYCRPAQYTSPPVSPLSPSPPPSSPPPPLLSSPTSPSPSSPLPTDSDAENDTYWPAYISGFVAILSVLGIMLLAIINQLSPDRAAALAKLIGLVDSKYPNVAAQKRKSTGK